MLTKPPSHQTRAKSLPPSPEFSPIIQNKPNSTRPTANSYFYKTNPISAYPASRRLLFLRNEPNFTRSGPMGDQKMQNEPNYRTAGVSPAFPPHPKNTKRTQFHPCPSLAHTRKYAKRTQFTAQYTIYNRQVLATQALSQYN